MSEMKDQIGRDSAMKSIFEACGIEWNAEKENRAKHLAERKDNKHRDAAAIR